MTRQTRLLNEARSRGFLTFRHDPKWSLRNAWFRTAELEVLPYVWLKEGRGRVRDQVEMDLLCYPRRPVHETVVHTINRCDHEIQKLLPFRTARQKRWIEGFLGSCVTHVKLPHPHGPIVASALAELARAGPEREQRE